LSDRPPDFHPAAGKPGGVFCALGAGSDSDLGARAIHGTVTLAPRPRRPDSEIATATLASVDAIDLSYGLTIRRSLVMKSTA